MRSLFFLWLIVGLLFPADSFAQRKKRTRTGPVQQEEALLPALDLRLEQSAVFDKGFTGFALYDPEADRMLYSYHSDKYFTPASNTKILTFYAGLRMLGDSIPALMYQKMGDLMIFWGTGDPAFLNPHLTQNEKVFRFLKDRPEKLLFCASNFRDGRYGSGWMWSDYPYAYQAEKSSFPVYSNVAHFRRDKEGRGIEIRPSFLGRYITYDSTLHVEDLISRDEFDNRFSYNKMVAQGDKFEQHAPFRVSPSFVAEILTDTLKRHVSVLNEDLRPGPGSEIMYSVSADSLYRLMMQESDNFVAEQILLLCAQRKWGYQHTADLIKYVRDSLLTGTPDPLYWVDGSGLSRYNLFTPRSVVHVLNEIYKQVPRNRLLNIFPAGGVSGTIRYNYRNGSSPYVFAKTGTLRHNHCLSGYLITGRGKLLIFSFMHNNYTTGTAVLKREMERVLKEIYRNY